MEDNMFEDFFEKNRKDIIDAHGLNAELLNNKGDSGYSQNETLKNYMTNALNPKIIIIKNKYLYTTEYGLKAKCRSKKKRIIKKWNKNNNNYGMIKKYQCFYEQYKALETRLYCHPAIFGNILYKLLNKKIVTVNNKSDCKNFSEYCL
jgi:hypothetical protein